MRGAAHAALVAGSVHSPDYLFFGWGDIYKANFHVLTPVEFPLSIVSARMGWKSRYWSDLLSSFSQSNLLVHVEKSYFDGQFEKDEYDNLISE